MTPPNCCDCGHPMTWYELVAFAAVFFVPISVFIIKVVAQRRSSPSGGHE